MTLAERIVALLLVAVASACFVVAFRGGDQTLWLVGLACLASLLAFRIEKEDEDEGHTDSP